MENLNLFKAHVRFSMASKIIILTHKFNEDALANLKANILRKFKKAIVHSGECVGPIAS